MLEDFSLFDLTSWYVVFLFSTTLHEASHAFVALKLGDDTAHRGGQVTLDPTPHIKREPIGMVVVPLLSYAFGGWIMGWASAPYDVDWARRYPRRAAWMAMAGPASNLLLMLIAAGLIRLGMAGGYFEPNVFSTTLVESARPGLWHLAAVLLGIFFSLNLILFFFNLIPLPPMDGCNIPFLFLSHEAGEKYREIMFSPTVRMFGLFIAWKVFGTIYPAIHSKAVHLLFLRVTNLKMPILPRFFVLFGSRADIY